MAWAAAVENRCRALLSLGTRAEGLFRSAIDLLATATRPRWTLSISLADVVSAAAGPARDLGLRNHTNVKAGESDSGLLICARLRVPTLEIESSAPPYGRIVLSVPDAESTAGQIQGALAARPR
jgi:hypothetical protein